MSFLLLIGLRTHLRKLYSPGFEISIMGKTCRGIVIWDLYLSQNAFAH